MVLVLVFLLLEIYRGESTSPVKHQPVLGPKDSTFISVNSTLLAPIFSPAKPYADIVTFKRTDKNLTKMCDKCKFASILQVREKSPKWKKATIKDVLANTAAAEAGAGVEITNRRNNLRRLMNMPMYWIKKGTKLLHGSKSRAWKSNCIGSDKPDGYSYFTPDEFGWAKAHASNFEMRVTYTTTVDIPVMFFPGYGYVWYDWGKHTWANGKTQDAVEEDEGSLGGPWYLSTNIIPAQYRLVGWIGCSECEVVLANDVIPKILNPSGVAICDPAQNAENFAANQKIVPFGDWPTCSGGTAPGIDPLPAWATKLKVDDQEFQAAEAAFKDFANEKNKALFVN